MLRIIAALLLLAAPAFAQQQPQRAQQPPAEPPLVDVHAYIGKLMFQRDEFAKRAANLEAENEGITVGFRKKIAEIEAYAKACGGGPGCWSPVEGK